MADEPQPKRPKICRDDDDYMPGNIIKIELCNFMTFNKLTCKPGSRLNLVIGPNGSGKSSLVCAIALGLGGEPQLLGRATSVGAYVKRGEESGYIIISLRGENKQNPISIMRKINTSNKSEWLLNGKSVGKKDIIEVIQKFNIQIGNLTQFLPQDRVCEFAKLSPIQLLEETEKAVGDPQLPLQHHSLILKSEEVKKLKLAVESHTGTLTQLRDLNAGLERDVKRVRQREKLLEKVESMKKKLPWLKYDIKKVEYLDAVKQEEAARVKLEEAAESLVELKAPIEIVKKEKAKQEANCRRISGLLDSSMKKRMQLLEQFDSMGVKIRGKYDEIEELKHQEEHRQQRLAKAKEDLTSAEEELANHRASEPPREKMEQLSSQILELEETANDMRTQRREKEKHLSHHKMIMKQHVDRLKEMENANNKRLNALRNSGCEKIFEAYHWVQEHRGMFKSEVYGPVLLEVNVASQMHANYLEGHVPGYIWKAFITQNSEDRDLLVKNLKSYAVPVINHVVDETCHRDPFRPTDEMRSLGISTRLDMVFEAPSAVKEVLIGQCGLHRAYVGSRETDEKSDQVYDLGVMDLWTPENHYRWIRSRYANNVSTSVDYVEHSRLLSSNSDSNEIDSVKSRVVELEGTISAMEDSIRELQSSERKKENEAAALQREREEIVNIMQSEKRKRRDMEQLVTQKRMKLKMLERDDDPDAERRLKDQVEELKAQQFKCITEIKNLLVEAVDFRRSVAEYNLSSIELEARISEMVSHSKQQEKLAMQASMHVDNCANATKKCKHDLEAAQREAESVAVITPELAKAFMKMPTTVEELESAIQDTTAEANAILFLNQNILEEYEGRQKKIEELAHRLEMDEKELNARLDEINSLKGSWLPKLRTLVSRINETFSRNFQEMAVAGEVSLGEHETDFSQYGILIKVKFRQTGQLQVLSAYHQSGGERSVSTILYLVSLQDLTNCPFRVVDEINQGMDPINERKMFQQLVRAASQPNTPQCFLLTPKLLPNLEYSEACSILTVMNGPWIEQPSKVWAGGENWRTICIPATENQC